MLRTTVAVNGFEGFAILPRFATEVYYNCSTPAQNLALYNKLYSGESQSHPRAPVLRASRPTIPLRSHFLLPALVGGCPAASHTCTPSSARPLLPAPPCACSLLERQQHHRAGDAARGGPRRARGHPQAAPRPLHVPPGADRRRAWVCQNRAMEPDSRPRVMHPTKSLAGAFSPCKSPAPPPPGQPGHP